MEKFIAYLILKKLGWKYPLLSNPLEKKSEISIDSLILRKYGGKYPLLPNDWENCTSCIPTIQCYQRKHHLDEVISMKYIYKGNTVISMKYILERNTVIQKKYIIKY